jgi:hypothetical protein
MAIIIPIQYGIEVLMCIKIGYYHTKRRRGSTYIKWRIYVHCIGNNQRRSRSLYDWNKSTEYYIS